MSSGIFEQGKHCTLCWGDLGRDVYQDEDGQRWDVHASCYWREVASHAALRERLAAGWWKENVRWADGELGWVLSPWERAPQRERERIYRHIDALLPMITEAIAVAWDEGWSRARSNPSAPTGTLPNPYRPTHRRAE